MNKVASSPVVPMEVTVPSPPQPPRSSESLSVTDDTYSNRGRNSCRFTCVQKIERKGESSRYGKP
ncbi:hypothetical protein K440DRAFT_621748 [Wilcoxina mikolae CBS 423.85]|nr:hypothetical protein K440DRAFT_621748 [Wilcoxina mikolae CBS 423.85]